MAVYADEIWVEFYNIVCGWFPFNPDVVGDIDVSYGINGTKPTDRVASSGRMTFWLRNDAGCQGALAGFYTPGHAGAAAGWGYGAPVRLRVVVDGVDHIKFYGYVTAIKPDSGTFLAQRVKVTVSDWFDFASRSPVGATFIGTNQTIDTNIVPYIIGNMIIYPTTQVYHSGSSRFPALFDTTSRDTMVLSELQKVALSEWGWVYLQHDWQDADTLVVEGRHTRRWIETDVFDIKQLIVLPDDSGYALQETSDYILLETGDIMLLDQAEAIIFDDDMTNLSATWGEQVINYVTCKTYPRLWRDSTGYISYPTVYQSTTPIAFNPGETQVFTVKFTDQMRQAMNVYAYNSACTSVGVWANTASDSTGTDKTSSFTSSITNTIYDAEITITNGSGVTAYVTRITVLAYAAEYVYAAQSTTDSDAASIAIYGQNALTVDMKYENDAAFAVDLTDWIVDHYKDPQYLVNKVDFLANSSRTELRAFLFINIGDLVHIKETQTALDAYFNIQAISFKIKPGGAIRFNWTLFPAFEVTMSPVWLIEDANYGQLGTTTVLAL